MDARASAAKIRSARIVIWDATRIIAICWICVRLLCRRVMLAPDIPFGITFFALAENESLICGAANAFLGMKNPPATPNVTTLVAVCGLHMRGYPLEKQMIACGATFYTGDDIGSQLPACEACDYACEARHDQAAIRRSFH